MSFQSVFTLFFFLFFSCSNEHKNVRKIIPILQEKEPEPINEVPVDSLKLKSYHLVDVHALNPAILVELKYATSDNFMGIQLYHHTLKAYLQEDVAERLSRVQNKLSELKPGYHLLIYDALRPVSVQQKMWDALDSIPPKQRAKFVSNPRNRSLHNLGAAIDLTIVDEHLVPLDMGAKFDEIREIAYPSQEKRFLTSGQLTTLHIANRDLLRKVMKTQGFSQLPTEWWHFNACTRDEGLKKYRVLMEEL